MTRTADYVHTAQSSKPGDAELTTAPERINKALAATRNAIANIWLAEAQKRITNCISTRRLNPAAVGSDKEARTAQYLLFEAAYYFEITENKPMLKAIEDEYKRLRDDNVHILGRNEMHILVMDRHLQMKARAERLGFRELAEDLDMYVRWHIADISGKQRETAPPEDKLRTLTVTGQEAMAIVLQNAYDGNVTTTAIAYLWSMATECASILGLRERWDQMVLDAEMAYERNGLGVFKRK